MCLEIIEEITAKLSGNKCLLKHINLKYIMYTSFSSSFFHLSTGEARIFPVEVCFVNHYIFISANVGM